MGNFISGFLINSLIKGILIQLILVLGFNQIAISQNSGNSPYKPFYEHPVYPPDRSDIGKLKRSVEPLMKMSIDEIIAEVPVASGIYFVGCPECNGGAQEGGVLGWKPGMGETVQCKYCSMIFPNKKYPNNREKVIISPGGTHQVYRYYENPEGRQYFFEPHAWYERWLWIRPLAEQLAVLWYSTQDNSYGDRAAAIAGRFAQVFPDYAIRFDYPNSPKKFFPANQKWPYEGLQPYRGAKWRWWGYDDIPTSLTNVYDILMSGYDWKRMDNIIGPETDTRIARDLLRLGYEFTTANPEVYSNKSPGMYCNMIRVGRVLGEPEMVHEAVKRFLEFFSRGFFADGWWKEGTAGYHDMTISGLKTVIDALAGYKDPEGWKGKHFDNIDLSKEIPLYAKALRVGSEAVLPNGREIPINDTWGYDRGEKTDFTVSRLWPSLGNASLGTGDGENQIMLNMNWSGNYGHSHYDNGSIILYAIGEELLSDIGYTHTKYRGWTIHTASHNTVVIDQMNQDAGSLDKPVTGKLMFYDDSNEHVKVIDVDASPAYSKAKTYRRRIVMVHVAPGRDYVVDRFDVEGGNDHDWFLHGMCEQEGTLTTSIPLDISRETLVPVWGGKNLPKTQSDTDPKRFHAYMYLQDVKSGSASKQWTATWRYDMAGLRTHIFSPEGTQVFRFRSPSVRLAGEDENKLDNYMHSGVMQRHTGDSSVFIAVHEPFRNEPWIESVKTSRKAIVVRYKTNGVSLEDIVMLNDGEVVVTSSGGWKYYSGTKRSGQVEALEISEGKWRLRLDKESPKVNFVRLDLADGGTRYYPVAAVNSNWLELFDDPGFSLESDQSRVRFHTFPQDQYAGPLRYTLFAPVSY